MNKLLLLAVFSLAAVASAQTGLGYGPIPGVVGTEACGMITAVPKCSNIPLVVNTSGGIANATVTIQQVSAGYYEAIFGNTGLGVATITSPIPTLSTAGGTINYSFKSGDYYGTMSLTYTTYWTSIGTPGWRWVIKNGTITIIGYQYGQGNVVVDHCYTYFYAVEWGWGWWGPGWYFGREKWNNCTWTEEGFTPWFDVG